MPEQRKGLSTWIKVLRNKAKSPGNPGNSSKETEETESTPSNNFGSTESYGLFEFPTRPSQPPPPSLTATAHSVDIIAVHGLSGSWRTTWRAGTGDDSAIWLRDRLPALLAQHNVRPRIRAFGYDSSYVFTSSTSDLESCAEDLLTRIRIARQTEEEKQAPIIFVAHSLGGLIVKLAINLAHTDDIYHKDVLEKTSGCLFLAVPFHGADAASWAELGSRIVSSMSFGMAANPGIPNALKRNSKDWMKISRDFVQRGKSMTFRSAYETEKIGRNTIVDEASVRNNVPNERVFPVFGSNHRNICKFDDHENERFSPVGLAVVEVVQAALDEHDSKYPLMSELPISTPKFYGRNIEFEEISSALNPSKLGRKGVVLFGIGGSGKTQLALQYVKKKKQLYKAVIWINAFTPEQTAESFTDTFQMISKSWPTKDLPNPYTGENTRTSVLARLRSTLHRNWLLIIDSADDLDNQNLIQLIPNSNHGSIIVTSTRQHASDILTPYEFRGIEIDELDFLSGKELLLGRAGMSGPFEDHDYARGIVKELNGLPLALEQAGILLRRKVVNLDNFVEEYRSNYNALMGHPPKAGEVQHDKTRSIHAILNMLYSHIKRESPTASAILRLLAIIGPSQIPITVLLDVSSLNFPDLHDDPDYQALRESSKALTIFRLHLTLLEDACLVKIRPASNTPLESILLHRAICQWVTREPTKQNNKWIVFVALALEDALCRGERDLDWPMGNVSPNSYLSRMCLTWIDHIASLINQLIDPADLQPPNGIWDAEYARVARTFGYIYFCNARYEAAKVSLSRVLEYAAFQPEHPEISSISQSQLYYCLGISHYKMGEFQQAENFLRTASEEAFKNESRYGNDNFDRIRNRLQEVLRRNQIIQRHHATAVVAIRGAKAQPAEDNDPTDEYNEYLPVDDNPGIASDLSNFLLHDAVTLGDLLRAEKLIQSGADVEARNEDDFTPLYRACCRGYEDVVGLLLDHEANIEAQNGRFNTTPLHIACDAGREGIVRILLEHSANIEARNKWEWTPLFFACNAGHKGIVCLLLEHGANTEAKSSSGRNPLHNACHKRYKDVARLLLDHNANIEAKSMSGKTPMHEACYGYRRHEDIVQLLLDRNADIEAKDARNKTPLHKACYYGHEDIVRLLLDNNADIEAMDEKGSTPLHYARNKGHASIVGLLLDRNANAIVGTEATAVAIPLH